MPYSADAKDAIFCMKSQGDLAERNKGKSSLGSNVEVLGYYMFGIISDNLYI